MADREWQHHDLGIGYRADALDGDLREITDAVNQLGEMTRAVNPVGEMTRAIREAQAVYEPLEIPEVMRAARTVAESIASQVPESVASIPRELAAMVPESVLDRTLDRMQRDAIRTAQERIDAVSAARRDIERITGYLPRGGW